MLLLLLLLLVWPPTAHAAGSCCPLQWQQLHVTMCISRVHAAGGELVVWSKQKMAVHCR
jgi:hypothetical protein